MLARPMDKWADKSACLYFGVCQDKTGISPVILIYYILSALVA